MFGPFMPNTGRPPRTLNPRTVVRVELRDGRMLEGPWINYAWGVDGDPSNIVRYAVEQREVEPDVMPTLDTLIKKKKKAGPTVMERMSRCLPDGFLWGDPLTPDALEAILDKYRHSEW